MKLSGHNYDNDVFSSLLNGLSNDVVLKKEAKNNQNNQNNVNLNFTKTTEDTFKGIVAEELKFSANELIFAAKKANVQINGDDLRKFANYAKSNNLKGKFLEREARKYCSDLSRELASPKSSSETSAEMLIAQANNRSITPAGSPDGEMNNGYRGGYMGQSKNPNTIWDSESLHRLAQIPESHVNKMGDEQISSSKTARDDFSKEQKKQFWDNIQSKMSEPDNLKSKTIASVHTQAKSEFNPNVSKSAMSMFSGDRDFSSIPDKTQGELIKDQSSKRSNKKAESKNSVIKGSKKAETELLSNSEKSENHNNSIHRNSVDRLFDGLAKMTNKDI